METFNTVIVGGGQAGVAMSMHLSQTNISHVVLEKSRVAEAWRTSRWDSLVANGPAWHDRFPDKEFADTADNAFATKDSCAQYFEDYVRDNKLPVRTGVEVLRVHANDDRTGYIVQTSEGDLAAANIVAATGSFQVPVIPPVIPDRAPVSQIHSQAYRNPDQLDEGAVLVVGAGSSGAQIADELLRSGREVYLSVGPHDRPPRSYRGHDFVYWLGVLGKWEMRTPPMGREHVTIAVSGAHGGHTVDFRDLAKRGMKLVGMTKSYHAGLLTFQPDLASNVAEGDANYLSLLEEADAYIARNNLDFPLEEDAKIIGLEPDCMTYPTREVDLQMAGISTVIWATGYRQDFKWLDVNSFDENGTPVHDRGISSVPGIYFIGLPWLSMRGSSFIWGVYVDAKRLANDITHRAAVLA
ncbi:MAG: NAD(P)/FAD-dependent oxidoreductase [Aliishimia sp.]